jgi:diadenosine tetraphosphate (Ap4A) HIT family hydrolase
MAVAEAVASIVRPIKMNYEIHGNSPPHLHLLLFPRQIDDPYVDFMRLQSAVVTVTGSRLLSHPLCEC